MTIAQTTYFQTYLSTPCYFVQQIPEKKEIPNLGASLVKLMQDFQVQVYK